MPQAKPILVTGATGNVGREVVRALLAQGVPFVAADRQPEKAERVLGPGVRAVALDLTRPETYAAALRGVRGVFLLRPPPISDVRRTLNVLIDRAVEEGVEHVVFLSVVGAGKQSWVPHHKVEQHLLRAKLAWTFLRPGFFAQNCADAYRRDLREADRLYLPAGRGAVSFVDVRDVAEVAVRAFEDPAMRGQAYDLTGPAAVGFEEVARVLSRELGRPIRYVPAGVLGYLLHVRRTGAPWGQAAIQTLLHVGLRFGNGAAVSPAIEELLGRPARSMETYLRDHVDLWRPDTAT